MGVFGKLYYVNINDKLEGIYTLFLEGTYLTIVVNLPYGSQTITTATKHTISH